MSLFTSKEEKTSRGHGILGQFSVDVIKWEPETDAEASIIVHKFELEDFPAGSQLIVHPSQTAVFINNNTSGRSEIEAAATSQVAVFIGPCKVRLETGDIRFAPFRKVVHALTGDESAYHSSVYFINTTYMNELNWGTQAPIVVTDPEEEINVHVRAFGLFGVHINHEDTDASRNQMISFLQKIVGTRANLTRAELTNFMRAKILEYVPDLLAKSIIERKIGVLKMSAYLSEFSTDVLQMLVPHFGEFGLNLDNFSFHNINVPDEDLDSINQMKIKKKRDLLEAEGIAHKMDIESSARARMREREGYTYQQEQSYNIMQAAAENEGMSSSFMSAGIGLGMGAGLGGVFGKEMGGVVRDSIGLINQKPTDESSPNDQMYCQYCQAKLPLGAKYCLICGKKVDDIHRCPDCGTILIKDAKFCYNCGRRLIRLNECPKCGASLHEGSLFCIECGEKI